MGGGWSPSKIFNVMQKKNYLVVIATHSHFTRNFVFIDKTVEEVVWAIEPKDKETKFLTEGHVARIYPISNSIAYHIHHKDDSISFRDKEQPELEYDLNTNADHVLSSHREGLAHLLGGMSIFDQLANYLYEELDFEGEGMILQKEKDGVTHLVEMYSQEDSHYNRLYSIRFTGYNPKRTDKDLIFYTHSISNFASNFTGVRDFLTDKLNGKYEFNEPEVIEEVMSNDTTETEEVIETDKRNQKRVINTIPDFVIRTTYGTELQFNTQTLHDHRYGASSLINNDILNTINEIAAHEPKFRDKFLVKAVITDLQHYTVSMELKRLSDNKTFYAESFMHDDIPTEIVFTDSDETDATHLDTSYCSNQIEHYYFFQEKSYIAETSDEIDIEVTVTRY